MLTKSRVIGAMDTTRLSSLVERPGIDPRTWVSLAIVTSVVIDPNEGPFVDIVLLPSQDEDTARVGAIYAGNGFGIYAPLQVDDEVLVSAPSGNPNEGLVVVQRLWSASDPPPAQAGNTVNDLLIQVAPKQNLRILTTGGGNVILNPDSGQVLLGAETGTTPVARKGDTVDMGTWAAAGTTVITVVTPDGVSHVLNATPTQLIAKILVGSPHVQAK